MPNVIFTRKKTKTPVRAEVYNVKDSAKKTHPLSFDNGRAELSLPSGDSILEIAFGGNSLSRVDINITSPSGKQHKWVRIPSGETSTDVARTFKV